MTMAERSCRAARRWLSARSQTPPMRQAYASPPCNGSPRTVSSASPAVGAASSLLGFYDELGPFSVNEKMELVLRDVAWSNDCHLLALDNPLGVGYSHTQSLERMATNQTTVGAPAVSNRSREPSFQPIAEAEIGGDRNRFARAHSSLFALPPSLLAHATADTRPPAGWRAPAGADLYEAVRQFFQLFPEYRSNDFFLTGESYAGKVPRAVGSGAPHTI